MLKKPDYWEEAKTYLQKQDAVLDTLIKNYTGEEGLVSRGDAFETLVRSIVGQQISVKAAASVWNKLADAYTISPEALAKVEAEQLRSCGLSRQKVKYITGTAQAFHNGQIHPNKWGDWQDEDIIQELTTLPGIGRWTAEMFLMFYLLRADVLPLKDLGILNAFERQYGKAPTELKNHATAWQPYRTVACWYLWRSLENQPTNY
ncbi:MAG: DNA-3-methyladenine glycosylase [Alphaproteobacteria bacterium]|nr:DNA-3-methyladenine glycosylase [Alphaproteobacteria bacterium]MDD9920337.1 DNA-3-methyladenine glycosylase [Alphaproteobacteria bacterium]